MDNSTGEFLVTQGKADYVDKLLQSFSPSEVLFEKSKRKEFEKEFGTQFFTHMLDDWVFTTDYSEELLLNQFHTKSLKPWVSDEIHGPTPIHSYKRGGGGK